MKETCDICGGSGQVGSFLGESRFVITWEECPECIGTGFIDPDNIPQTEINENGKTNDSQE